MGKEFPELDEKLRAFVTAQAVFFVGTAPQGAQGHVNLSPKGLDSLRILGPREVAYLDFVGSGAETIAHLRENGRITLLFCAFQGPPKILRLYGRGRVLEPHDEGFDELRARFPPARAVRSVIVVELTRIADSCGYGVPLYELQGQRDQLDRWAARKSDEQIADYQRRKNARSVDDLPALRFAPD